MKRIVRILSLVLCVTMMIECIFMPTYAADDLNQESCENHRLYLTDDMRLNTGKVWIDGVPFSVQQDAAGKSYVELPDCDAKSLVTYTYENGDPDDVHTQYPTGMRVWKLEHDDSGYTATYVPELRDLLQYSGMSIRVTGKKGIRMITAVEKDKKNALTSGGLAGYSLKEYGTAIAWANQISISKPLVLGRSYVKSNYAYRRGVADPVFAYSDNKMQYTNVIVNFSNDQCKNDMAMRPYIILESEDGEEITIYGGIVYRSIGYIAYQNRKDVFEPGTKEYEYVWDIIHNVYGDIYDGDMDVEPEENVPEITVETVNATAGSTVDVAVTLANNPGMVGMTLKLNYDESAMTLTKVTRGSALSEMTFTTPRNLASGCQLPWDAEEVLPENATNGEILTLTFAVSETAAPGSYGVSLSYNNGAIIDNDLNPVEVVIRNGAVVVGGIPVEMHTVTFVDYNGEVLKTETVIHGGSAAAPADPTRDGYVFTGWDKAFDNVTSDLTVTALYEEIPSEEPTSDPTITVGTVNATAGSTVDVAVTLANNPGMVGMTLKLNYDESAMTLTKVTRGSALSEMTFTTPRNLASGCQLPWDAEEVLPENATNGEILTLTFAVSETAAPGSYGVSLSYNNGAIIDNDLMPVEVVIRNGAVIVR